MLAESGRRAADVHGDIEDAAAHHPHQLVLSERGGLEMQTAQGSDFGRKRVIVLHEIQVEAGLKKRLAVVNFRKKAAMVAEFARGDDLHIGNGGCFNL